MIKVLQMGYGWQKQYLTVKFSKYMELLGLICSICGPANDSCFPNML
jgi:hypothetical protein